MNIKQSFRIIFRNKTYSILNIFGLAVGIACTTLIFLWVEKKMSYNRDIPNLKNVYAVAQNQHYDGKIKTFFVASGPLSKTLNESFSDIKQNTRLSATQQSFEVEKKDESFSRYGCYADATIFDMLKVKFIYGNPNTAFSPAFPIVINKKIMTSIFGNQNPVGKTMRAGNRYYEITGVVEEAGINNEFQYDWYIPFRVFEKDLKEKGFVDPEEWGSNWMSCYVEVQPSANIEVLNKKLKKLAAEKTDGKVGNEYFIYPVTKRGLYSEFVDGKPTGSGYIRTVRLYMYIGLLILLIACINYMNLSTARSQKRTLEVGVKKTFGAKQRELIQQFLGESAFITFIALLLAIILILLCLPYFNQLISDNLHFDFTNYIHVLGILGIWVVCTFLAGSYPAFYLSSYSPLSILKKQKAHSGSSAAWIRKGLVVFQFSAAFILICSTAIIYLQIQHIQNRDLGIKKENLVLYTATEEIKNSYEAVHHELQATGYVENSGLCDQSLLGIGSNGGGFNWQGKEPATDPLISFANITPGLIEAAGLKIVEGRNFSSNETNAKNLVIINEALAEIMKKEGRVGGHIWHENDAPNSLEIIGIVKNFVFNNIKQEKPGPVLFSPDPKSAYHLFVRLKPNANITEALAKVKATLKKFTSGNAFDAFFMQDGFNNMVREQKQEGSLAALFAGLAIFISCMGLFGLSAFSAEQRTKEIGVRKVLGASVLSILRLLARSYMLLILNALVIGLPIAWYITSSYLSDYTYRIPLSWTIFAGVAILVGLIAIITVSFQSFRAAVANPVDAIKTE